jgi:hypothetical protein
MAPPVDEVSLAGGYGPWNPNLTVNVVRLIGTGVVLIVTFQ